MFFWTIPWIPVDLESLSVCCLQCLFFVFLFAVFSSVLFVIAKDRWCPWVFEYLFQILPSGLLRGLLPVPWDRLAIWTRVSFEVSSVFTLLYIHLSCIHPSGIIRVISGILLNIFRVFVNVWVFYIIHSVREEALDVSIVDIFNCHILYVSEPTRGVLKVRLIQAAKINHSNLSARSAVRWTCNKAFMTTQQATYTCPLIVGHLNG